MLNNRTSIAATFVAGLVIGSLQPGCGGSQEDDYTVVYRSQEEHGTRPEWKPINGDKVFMANLGKEAMATIGYDEIIQRAEKEGWIKTVRIAQIKDPPSKVLIGDAASAALTFGKVFTEYAVKAGITSQLDSPVPGPADALAVGILVFGLIQAGKMAAQEISDAQQAQAATAAAGAAAAAGAVANATPTAKPTTTTTSPPVALPRRCLPCLPVPVGGIAYRYDSAAAGNRSHYGMANHTHHFQMHQSPPAKGCRCFWADDFIHPTPEFSPLPGAIPVSPAGGGGVAP